MFDALNYDHNFTQFINTYGNKKILVYAKIDGTTWYDISDYVKYATIDDKITLLGNPVFSTAKLTLANPNNVWTPTQYNDTFDPNNGKINGAQNDNYLNKIWEVKIFAIVSRITDGIELPEATVEYWRKGLLGLLNNTTPDGITAQEAEQNDIVLPLFWGWKPANGITEKNKTAEMKLYDRLYVTALKKIPERLLYTSFTPDQIVADLLNRAGITTDLDLQSLTTKFDVFLTDEKATYWASIQKVVNACGGKITVSPDGKIKMRTEIENYADPGTAASIDEENIKNYTLKKHKTYNEIKLNSTGFTTSTTNNEVLVDTELTGENANIAGGQTAKFECQYISDYGKDFDNTIYITVKQADTVLDDNKAFTVGDSDSYIKLVAAEKKPSSLILTIKNMASSTTYTISHIKFYGRAIKKTNENHVVLENTDNTPTSTLSLPSYYSNNQFLSRLADILKKESNKSINFLLTLNGFYGNIYAGNLVEASIPAKGISSGTFIVEEVNHKIESGKWQTQLLIREFANVTFTTSGKTISTTTVASAIQESPYQTQINDLSGEVTTLNTKTSNLESKTAYIDGAVPATPTGLSLSTTQSNGESTITATWDANTESDLIGYEIAWSYDGTVWTNMNVTNNGTTFTVLGNMTVYVKVRALDAEGNRSTYCTAVSITSSKDETAPAKPTGLAVTGLFQTIMVKWNKNTESDFDHYLVQYDTHSNFSAATTIKTSTNSLVIKDLGANSTYYVRVAAVDKSGNVSSYCTSVSASTVNIDDENYYDYAAIKNAIIHNGYIDSAWISNLDAGKITSGYISADRIEAGSITVDKLVAKPAMALPEGAIAYWTKDLIDMVANVAPEGYDEVNLKRGILLTDKNVPESSVVAGLIAGNKIYAGKSIQVGNAVKIEADSSGNGKIVVNNGSGNPVVKIGEDAINGTEPGLSINGANLVVDGTIKANYIDTAGFVVEDYSRVWTKRLKGTYNTVDLDNYTYDDIGASSKITYNGRTYTKLQAIYNAAANNGQNVTPGGPTYFTINSGKKGTVLEYLKGFYTIMWGHFYGGGDSPGLICETDDNSYYLSMIYKVDLWGEYSYVDSVGWNEYDSETRDSKISDYLSTHYPVITNLPKNKTVTITLYVETQDWENGQNDYELTPKVNFLFEGLLYYPVYPWTTID